jgi:hypothetical protein
MRAGLCLTERIIEACTTLEPITALTSAFDSATCAARVSAYLESSMAPTTAKICAAALRVRLRGLEHGSAEGQGFTACSSLPCQQLQRTLQRSCFGNWIY